MARLMSASNQPNSGRANAGAKRIARPRPSGREADGRSRCGRFVMTEGQRCEAAGTFASGGRRKEANRADASAAQACSW